MKIYTKTGDQGETALLGGRKIIKSHLKIEAYGTVDELNSYIGLIKDCLENKSLLSELKHIQDTLFDVGSNLALDLKSDKRIKLDSIEEEDVVFLEKAIDKMNEDLPALQNFILPGGHKTVSFIHIARCICRRAERVIVSVNVLEVVKPELLKYMNRLSDYLFVLARFVAKNLNATEVLWQPRKKLK